MYAKFVVSFVFLFLAYQISDKGRYRADLDRVLDGLLREETFRSINLQRHKVAIGFGSCVDVFSYGLDLLRALDIKPPEETVHHDVLSSGKELAEGFAYFFQYGAAAERFVSDSELFQHWVEKAKELNSSSLAIGGNAPVMANRFAMEGWSVLLGSVMGKETTRLLHSNVKVTGNPSDSAREDVHLVLEYDLGSTWGKYVSPRANRYIVHNDYSNMMLESLDSFITSLKDFKPSLVVVGGLQMLDNFPYDPEIRTAKLKLLSKTLSSLPASTKIHFEMASFTEHRLMKELVEFIVPHADSLGMNEQELVNLCNFIEYGNITLVSDPYPRVAMALDQVRRLYSLLTSSDKFKKVRTVSRVHVHTLAYQAILIAKQSGWKNMHAAVAKASLTANRHVCNSKQINTLNARLIMDDSFSVSQSPGSHRMPFIDSAPISCWNEDSGRICVAPNLVCTKVLQTAGGGDNVSAAGLALQL